MPRAGPGVIARTDGPTLHDTAGATAWHAMPLAQALARLDSAEGGLSSREAAARLERVGQNVLPSVPPPGLLAIGLRQLKSPLIYILLASAVVALFLREFNDAGFIALVLTINSAVGGYQEWSAERQRHGLQQLLQIRATALRDGRWLEIDAAHLVPGDVVALESGQRVPADLRLIDAVGLEIEEALLTGESLPVAKDAAWHGGGEATAAEAHNLVFAGSTVARGRTRAVVVATGAATMVGRLALSIGRADAGLPPLVSRMERFSRVIAFAVLGAAVLIGLVGVVVHHASAATMFMTGVALAVSAIPEGLPVAITIALAVAARRMAARGAIVRRLPAVEGLGSCTLIASDKTGTLTCNELTACELYLSDGTRAFVSGAGYAPDGRIETADGEPLDRAHVGLLELLEIAAACNEADLERDEAGWRWRGDPTDVALLALSRKGGVERASVLTQRPALGGVPFEPVQRFAATEHRDGSRRWIAVKGAPESVFPMCTLEPAERGAIEAAAMDMASRGQRVLALASGRGHGRAIGDDPAGAIELSGLKCAGLVGLIDPLRPEAAGAVGRCIDAGVRVVMITGDHPATALAIAKDLGLASGANDVVRGADLRSGDGERLRRAVLHGRVFARVTPDQKLSIVRAAQEVGHFVAVTGDGVNDAPALRHANIGVAMGRGGTDVARDAADVVLGDDNFATIVAGIEEGRVAYQNIRNVVYLVVAAGVAEVLTVGSAVMLGLPLPLLPTQLLWLNLVTNGIQDVSLAFEGKRGDELHVPPRRPQESIFDRLMVERVLLGGLWMATMGLVVYAGMLRAGVPLPDARNVLMLLMVLMQNVDTFNARSETVSAFRMPLRRNPTLVTGVTVALLLHVLAMHFPPLQRLLDFGPVAAITWLWLGAAALSLLFVMELQKAGRRRRPIGRVTAGRGNANGL